MQLHSRSSVLWKLPHSSCSSFCYLQFHSPNKSSLPFMLVPYLFILLISPCVTLICLCDISYQAPWETFTCFVHCFILGTRSIGQQTLFNEWMNMKIIPASNKPFYLHLYIHSYVYLFIQINVPFKYITKMNKYQRNSMSLSTLSIIQN